MNCLTCRKEYDPQEGPECHKCADAKEKALCPSDATACSAFFIRRATPPTYTRWTSGRHGSGVRENAGTAATVMVCGIEWTSRVPRTQTECDQTNAWAAKIISQNDREHPVARHSGNDAPPTL